MLRRLHGFLPVRAGLPTRAGKVRSVVTRAAIPVEDAQGEGPPRQRSMTRGEVSASEARRHRQRDFRCYVGSHPPRFAHVVEAECAAILDYYGVPWEYEPVTFVLETDASGRVVEAFSPDFHLPDQNLFLEITTMRQELVTRKNRKLRKLRERYPDVNVKLFYRRDIEALGRQLLARRRPGGAPATAAQPAGET